MIDCRKKFWPKISHWAGTDPADLSGTGH